jgi:peroxiredoxin
MAHAEAMPAAGRLALCDRASLVMRRSGFHSMPRRACRAGLLGLILAISMRAHADDLAIGQPAPAITLATLDGARIDSANLRGNVVIVTFWATWCAPCRDELPVLSRYAAEHAKQGLTVLGFSLDGAEARTKVAAIAHTLNFPVGLLDDPHVRGYGRIWHLPVSFVIDRQGRLAHNGWRDKNPVWDAQRLERIVTPLLDAGTSNRD